MSDEEDEMRGRKRRRVRKRVGRRGRGLVERIGGQIAWAINTRKGWKRLARILCHLNLDENREGGG